LTFPSLLNLISSLESSLCCFFHRMAFPSENAYCEYLWSALISHRIENHFSRWTEDKLKTINNMKRGWIPHIQLKVILFMALSYSFVVVVKESFWWNLFPGAMIVMIISNSLCCVRKVVLVELSHMLNYYCQFNSPHIVCKIQREYWVTIDGTDVLQ
jgi:hypothetical protein